MRRYYRPDFQAIVRGLVGCTAAALAVLGAYRSLREGWSDILARRGNVAGTLHAIRLSPGNARYWVELAYLKEPGASASTDALEHARKLNPHDAAAWIQSGLQAEAHGDRMQAETFLLRAELLSRQCQPQIALANFYFRGGDQVHFWPRVRRALSCTNEDRKPLFDLCWNMTDDAAIILQEAIPGVPAVGRDFLNYLLSQNRLDAAEIASRPVTRSAVTSDRELLLRYTDRMAGAGRWGAALAAWNALCERKIVPYAPAGLASATFVTNGRLTSRPLNGGFDWVTPEVQGVTTSWKSSPPGLRIEFSGKQPEQCEILRQFVPVQPRRTYAFRGSHDLSGISPGSGLQFRLTDADRGREIAAVGLNGGAAGVSFQVPEGTSMLRLSLWYRRMPETTRVEGSIVLTGIRLEAER